MLLQIHLILPLALILLQLTAVTIALQDQNEVEEHAEERRKEKRVKPYKCNCGVPKSFDVNRILGATEAVQNQYPWMVGFYRRNTTAETLSLSCGGVLITDRHILTTATCGSVLRAMKWSELSVLLGSHNPTLMSNSRVEKKVRKVVLHPSYKEGALDYNIAVLTINSPINLEKSTEIQPICVSGRSLREYYGVSAVISGWGRAVADGNPSMVLRHAIMRILKSAKCEGAAPAASVCVTDNKTGRIPCSIDQGGPLMYQENNKYILLGLIPPIERCQVKSKQQNHFYTALPDVQDWIKQEVMSVKSRVCYDEDFFLE